MSLGSHFFIAWYLVYWEPLFLTCCLFFYCFRQDGKSTPSWSDAKVYLFLSFKVKCLFFIINTFKAVSFPVTIFPYPKPFQYLVPLLLILAVSVFILYYLIYCLKGFELFCYKTCTKLQGIVQWIPTYQAPRFNSYEDFPRLFHPFVLFFFIKVFSRKS